MMIEPEQNNTTPILGAAENAEAKTPSKGKKEKAEVTTKAVEAENAFVYFDPQYIDSWDTPFLFQYDTEKAINGSYPKVFTLVPGFQPKPVPLDILRKAQEQLSKYEEGSKALTVFYPDTASGKTRVNNLSSFQDSDVKAIVALCKKVSTLQTLSKGLDVALRDDPSRLNLLNAVVNARIKKIEAESQMRQGRPEKINFDNSIGKILNNIYTRRELKQEDSLFNANKQAGAWQ